MKVDLNKDLVTPKGESLKQKLSDILAELLSTETRGNARKLWLWSLQLASTGWIEIDVVDAGVIEGVLESTERVSALVKGQILEVIDLAKTA